MTRLILTCAVATLAWPALAQDPPAVAAPCATCHGGDGIATMSTYPNLAGQNEAYLKAALKAYRAGNRSGGTAGLMGPMAKSLSDEDIDALASYYSSLPTEKQ